MKVWMRTNTAIIDVFVLVEIAYFTVRIATPFSACLYLGFLCGRATTASDGLNSSISDIDVEHFGCTHFRAG